MSDERFLLEGFWDIARARRDWCFITYNGLAFDVPFLVADTAGGTFLGWYAYDGGTHTLYSRYHVYALRSGDQLYKLQLLGYYGDVAGAPVSALYQLRYAAVNTDGSGDNDLSPRTRFTRVRRHAAKPGSVATNADRRFRTHDFSTGEDERRGTADPCWSQPHLAGDRGARRPDQT